MFNVFFIIMVGRMVKLFKLLVRFIVLDVLMIIK